MYLKWPSPYIPKSALRSLNRHFVRASSKVSYSRLHNNTFRPPGLPLPLTTVNNYGRQFRSRCKYIYLYYFFRFYILNFSSNDPQPSLRISRKLSGELYKNLQKYMSIKPTPWKSYVFRVNDYRKNKLQRTRHYVVTWTKQHLKTI